MDRQGQIFDERMDGRTDRQTDRQGQILMPPDYRHGGIKNNFHFSHIKAYVIKFDLGIKWVKFNPGS